MSFLSPAQQDCTRRTALGAALALFCVAHPAQAQIYSSTADTVFDIITTEDPSSFVCLSYEGRTIRQMWDKRENDEFNHNVFLFHAHYDDAPPIDIILNPEFGTVEEARAEALRYTYRIGQLPLVFRHGIRQFGIHKGRQGFHAGTGKIFMYQDQASHRIAQNKLEESILHEAVHASWDAQYRLSPKWVEAQQADRRFMTGYGASRPDREDLAETALFAYALLSKPGRIPPVDSRDILAAVPARIAVIEQLLARVPDVAAPPPLPENCE